MGYSAEQLRDMERTINACECDVVVIATPIDLRRLVDIKHPTVRVGYELEEIGRPKLEDVIGEFFARREEQPERRQARRPGREGRGLRSAANKPPIPRASAEGRRGGAMNLHEYQGKELFRAGGIPFRRARSRARPTRRGRSPTVSAIPWSSRRRS